MASFLRSAAPPRPEWSVEEAALFAARKVEEAVLFAARKEFELLKLLSTDKNGPWRRRVVSASSSASRRCSRERLLQSMRAVLLPHGRLALLTTRR